ncbi:26S proteasome regulatory complex, non-ATPase subcomplex, Rpn1 subunit [Microthyrium microscopicum]|uniref:26S proteasome regulatory subunit RPN1 n=1 Tax=Microthyrium microscopicum TaxID=703497 RepID=A0A6A6UIY8_9PEZI|nr:26S proteasome regulatory complex, non-ATPase subcomplex, Rpn1 subunit [Microthyrium microscopicum]
MSDKDKSTSKPTSAAKPEDKAVDKGKGKATDGEDASKSDEKDKDETKIGAEEELNEEDQKLKDDLDMLAERLLEDDKSLYKSSLDAIKESIKTSTSSMTAVPKPLKFLRPHYDNLTKAFDSWPEGDDKNSMADMLSVLGMTYSEGDRRDTLKYRLYYPSDDLGSWGHEYMRHLALEIGAEFNQRLDEDKSTDELEELALSLVPFFLKHNAEADAVDLISDLDMISKIPKFLDENTYSRVCLYMVSMVPLLAYPDNDNFLQTAYNIYKQYKQYTQALVLAIRLNDIEKIEQLFAADVDKSTKRQMAFILGRQKITLDSIDEETEEDPELAHCINNTWIHEYYRNNLAKELSITDPKTPEDIYKTHLESSRTMGLTNTDSARHNLASAFVNAFVNLGFSNDKLMLVSENKSSWVWKTKDEGMMSTAASLGMLLQWNIDEGLDKIDPYTDVDEEYIKAGALLAMGIMNSGVRNDIDPTLALLGDSTNLNHKNPNIRMASIMGLGLAYAGSNKDTLLDVLLPIVQDTGIDMKLSAMAALSLGLVFVGTAQGDVLSAIIQTFMDDDRASQLKDKWTRFMTLAIGLLCFGRQEEVEVVLEALKVVDHPVSKASQVIAEVCAWAGTGAVLKIQELLHMCNEHVTSKDSDAEEEDKDASKPSEEEVEGEKLCQSYAVLGLALVAMGEDIGQDMILRQFGHLMHYGEPNIRKVVPLAMALVSPSYPQMKIYDTLSRYSHDNDIDVAINAIFAMGILGAGTNNARLAQLLRQLASYYHRDANALFMVRMAQGLLHMGKGTLTVNPFHTDRSVLSRVSAAGLLTIMVALIDARDFVLKDAHYLFYLLAMSAQPRWLVTLDENLEPLSLNVRVGTAVDVVGQAGRPKTITGWQTQSTPVLLSYGERAELEDEKYLSVAHTLEGVVILKKNPDWEE